MAAAARWPPLAGVLLPALVGVHGVAQGSTVLVCLVGRIGDLQRTAAEFAEQLLAPFLRAGRYVEVFASDVAGAEVAAALVALRAAVQTLPGAAWGLRTRALSRDATARARRQVRVNLPRTLSAFEGTWLGRLFVNSSSEAAQEAADEALFRFVQQDACLRRFRQHVRNDTSARLVYTQAAFHWRCPHPPLELLKPDTVFIPDSVEVEKGLDTWHAVLNRVGAEAYLGGWRWIFSKEARMLESLDGLESPEAFLELRLLGKRLRIQRFARCAHRACGDAAEGTTPRCELGSSARYPWESATSLAVSECFATLITARNLVDWTGEALQECHQISVAFPEDVGINYPSLEAHSPEILDLRRCLREWHDTQSLLLESGALLDRLPQDPMGRMTWFAKQRHRCRSMGYHYVVAHSLNSVGMCVPNCCPLEVVPTLAWRTSLMSELPKMEIEGLAHVHPSHFANLAAAGTLDKGIAINRLAAEDPLTGAVISAKDSVNGPPTCWAVPLSSVAGVDFALAGFPRAGTTTIYTNLAQHPEVSFSEASGSQFEDGLFAFTHTDCVRARERRLIRAEGLRRRRRVFGVYDSNIVTRQNTLAHLRTVHRRRPVKLIVAVRHPIELLESNLNYVPPQVTDAIVDEPEHLLQAEWVMKLLLPAWSEENLLMVPLDALARRPRAALNRICRFLGIGPLSPDQQLVLGNARPRGPWAISLHGPRAPRALKDTLYRYYADDATALRALLRRFGGWEGFGPLLVGPPCPAEAREDEEAHCFADRLRSDCCHDLGNLDLPGRREPVALPEQDRVCQPMRPCCERFKVLHLALTKALRQHSCGADVKETQSCFSRFGWVPEVRLGRRPTVQLSEDASSGGKAVAGASAVARPRRPVADDRALDKDGDARSEPASGLGSPNVGLVEAHGDRSALQCFRLRGLPMAECLLRVRVKDPWGCHRNLRPDWARGAAWVGCCGGAGVLHARVLVTPCPSMQCCLPWRLSNRSKGFLTREPVLAGGDSPVPPWLTCAKAPDKRWLHFHKQLLDTRKDLKHRHIRELALELVASKDSGGEGEVMRRLREVTNNWGFGPDPAYCFVGFATALYVVAVGDENEPEREWHRWQLLQLLNVGMTSHPDLLPLAWFLDIGGWPIPVAELVAFALDALPSDFEARGSLRGSFPILDLPTVASGPAGVPPQSPGTGPSLSLLLISSHLFALDAAFALAAALATTDGPAALRWLGFPEKFAKRKFAHVERICSSTLPRVTCGGPGAAALDRLLELISIARFAPPGSKREVRNGKFWPYNVLLDRPNVEARAARFGGIAWASLVAELSALLPDFGDEPVLCGYPAVLCLALDEALRLSGRQRFLAVALSGTPVEYAEAALQPELWRLLHDINSQPDRALLCVSHFDEAHLWVAAGLRVPRPTFGARYIASAVAPAVFAAPAASPEVVLVPPVVNNEASQQILVSRLKLAMGARGAELMWQLLDDLCVGHLCPYRFVSYEVFFDWDVLNDFRAAVFFPWNWELITFLEWYSLGIPTFVPGPSWTIPLILHSLKEMPSIKGNATTWVNLRPEWAHGVSDEGRPAATADNVARWWARTDYTRLPYVRSFAHLGDLVRQVGGCDFRTWAAMLHRENARAHRATAAWYLQLAGRMRGAVQQS